jgi:transcriptional regulator with XRE-family HTH domain
MSESLGARLRQERERRRIDLSAIASTTKVSAALFRGLERDDVSRWPSGIFRRAFVRAYAEAIGLDPEATLREFLERFPHPSDPSLLARPDGAPASTHGRAALRLTFGDDTRSLSGGTFVDDVRRRCAILAADGGIVLATAAAASIVSGKFWMPLAIVMIGYYIGSVLLLGNTAGARLLSPRASSPTRRDADRRRVPAQVFASAGSSLDLLGQPEALQ